MGFLLLYNFYLSRQKWDGGKKNTCIAKTTEDLYFMVKILKHLHLIANHIQSVGTFWGIMEKVVFASRWWHDVTFISCLVECHFHFQQCNAIRYTLSIVSYPVPITFKWTLTSSTEKVRLVYLTWFLLVFRYAMSRMDIDNLEMECQVIETGKKWMTGTLYI